MKSQRNLQAQLKTVQANTRPKILIELASLLKRKIVFKKFPRLQKKIKQPTHQADKKALYK
jgi:hypothetical protein